MSTNYIRTLQSKISFVAGFVALFVFAFTAVAVVPRAYADDCGPNAIIYCGFNSSADFIKKLRNNNDHNGSDLQKIFAQFGLTSDEYDRFAATAKSGTVYRDGRIVVDGKTVATGAYSLGRTTLDGRHDKTMKIGGKTYYYGLTSRVFLSNSIPAKVMFDSNGQVEIAVLTDCGNPVWGNNVKPVAKCDLLSGSLVSGSADTFTFNTSATSTGNAVINRYVYDFGDGTTKTDASKTVTHQFKSPGTYKVKVTVFATVPGGGTISTTATECEKTVTVQAPVLPYYECVELKAPEPNGLTYTFTALARFGNGATFVGGDFTFGDGKSVMSVKPTTQNTIIVQHTYDSRGNYDASAVLHFVVNGKTVNANTCATTVTPTGAVPECKPGIPVGDVRCEVCQYDSSLTADDVNCKAPVTTLPNTGAGNVIAVGAAALIGGFLFYRHRTFNKHKLAFRQAEQGTSPLPLADPLNPEEPLANTPVESKVPVRSTLRRRRQF